MNSTPIFRETHLKELRQAWRDSSIRLIHIYGVAGAGKTTIARQLLSENDTPTIEFQCHHKMQLDLRRLMKRLEEELLNTQQVQMLHKKLREALIASSYEHVRRSHRISLRDSAKIIAQGDVVVGDKIQKSDAQYLRDEFEECRLRLELLSQLIGPFDRPVCTIFLDSLEVLDKTDNTFCQWLSAHCLEPGGEAALIPIRVLTTSRLHHSLICNTEVRSSVHVGPMSESEAESLLQRHGISDQKIIQWLICITRAHPQALVLASRLFSIVEMESFILPSCSSVVYEELCTEILLRSILEREKDELLRRAMTTIPIFRFFTADQVSDILQCSVEETQRILTNLQEGGFIESIKTVFKYHDLLRDLTLKFYQTFWGKQALRRLHLQAARTFHSDSEDTEFLNIVEPFYHLLQGDLSKAVEYSEKYIKPALDRKERKLSSILLSQIDLDSLPDTPLKGWLLLRYGGYYREFRNFPKAIKVFEKVSSMVGADERLLASVFNNIGWVYLYLGGRNHDERAIEFFERSNTICRKNGYNDILAMNLNNMGIGYSHLQKGDRKKELECYNQCLVITESEQNPNYLVSGMAFQNAGLVYQKRRDYSRALVELGKALERFRVCRCPQREAEILYHIACVLFDSKDYTNSRKFLDSSLNKLQSQQDDKDPYYLGENFFTLAMVLEQIGEFDNMRQCLLSMAEISLKENIDYHISTAQRTVQFCRYLFAVHGHNFAQETLKHLAEQWTVSDIGRDIPHFSDFLISEIKNLACYRFWSNGRSRLIHLSAGKKCKPIRWDRVLLRETDINEAVMCKKCTSAMVLTDKIV